MPKRSSELPTTKPDPRDFKYHSDYKRAVEKFNGAKAVSKRNEMRRANDKVEWRLKSEEMIGGRRLTISSGGQKQGESPCPPKKEVTDPVNHQSKAKVTWSDGDAEKKKREEA